MFNEIHIFGASGSGTTTLGRELSQRLPHEIFDSDDYFWLEKFSKQRDPQERLQLLRKELSDHNKWILSGAICGWGDILKPIFDLVIFLYVPAEERLNRLRAREVERYGDSILPGGEMHEKSNAFINWAALYDTAGPEVRSKVLHEQWISDLKCPVLRIEGNHSVQERVDIILNFIEMKKL